MQIQELVKQAHDQARSKGWWTDDNGQEVDRNPLELQMLIVSEIAEACEEARKGRPAVYFNTPTGQVSMSDLGGSMNLSVGETLQKPEGELIELADAVIRIADYCGKKGWDLEKAIKSKLEFNQTRPARHGGKLF